MLKGVTTDDGRPKDMTKDERRKTDGRRDSGRSKADNRRQEYAVR